MIKRRILCSALAMVMATSIGLTGCGEKTDTQTEKTTTSSTAAQNSAVGEEKPQLDPIELKWYYDGPGPQKDVKLIENEMNKYLKDKINTTVSLNALDWGSYDQKVQVLLASGEQIDLVFSCSWALQYPNAIAKGWLTDLTGLLDKNAPETKKLLTDSDWLAPQSIDGKIYNLPAFKEMASQGGICYNKDLADKYGLDFSNVKTYKDLESIFKTVKEKDPTIIPFAMTNGGNVYHAGVGYDMNIPLAVTYCINLDPTTDKWGPVFKDATFNDYLTQTRKYYTAGYINKDAATLKDTIPLVKAEKAFSYPVQLKPGKDGEESKAMGLNIKQVATTKVISTQTDLVNSMMAVPVTAKDPARSLMFYNLMYTDEYLINLMDYGIEGTHWQWKDKDNKIVEFAPATNGGKDSGWNHGTNWMFGNQLKSYLFVGEDPNKWKNFDEFNKAAVRGPDFGFTFNSETVKKEVSALKNIDIEFMPSLYSGFMDPAKYLEKYESKAMDAGLQKVIDEMNKQYEAFKANKK